MKNKYANILWATFVAFGIAPLMGAVFIILLRSGKMARGSGLRIKAESMNFTGDWSSYFTILTQAVGVGGVFVFGFVVSWIFGREFSDGTSKDLLALPTSRSKIIHAKFSVYLVWCILLVISNLIIATIMGLIIGIPVAQLNLWEQLQAYFNTTWLTVLLGTPIAFFAMWGKGYLAPIGFLALTIVFSQIIAATGYGSYFPWAVPGLYSGAGGDYKNQLDTFSYLLLAATGLAGYWCTLFYWRTADQTK